MIRRHVFEVFRKFDWLLFVSAMVLVFLGLAGIGSVGLSKEPVDFGALYKQMIFAAAGVLIVFVFALAHPTRWRFASWVIYAISIVSLLGVLVFGLTVRGTTGWFSLWGVRIQPVEAAKVALILVLARFLSEHLQLAGQLKIFWRTGALLLPPIGLVLFQPDTGSASILVILWISMLLVVGIKKTHLVAGAVGAALFAVMAWFFLLAPYQKERLLTFLNPERDPLGSGYNVTQSIIAVGSGQFFGRGLGFGAQSQMKFLPEAQTDFVFAVLAEELGLAAVAVIFLAFGVFFYRILEIAKRTNDSYSQLVVLGVFTVTFYEMFVNIGMNVGMIPVAGITLPFVSYGGSSLFSHFAMLGLLEGIAMRSPRV